MFTDEIFQNRRKFFFVYEFFAVFIFSDGNDFAAYYVKPARRAFALIFPCVYDIVEREDQRNFSFGKTEGFSARRSVGESICACGVYKHVIVFV